jgi:hypothetical protein
VEHSPDEIQQDINETRKMVEKSKSHLKKSALKALDHIEEYMNNHTIEVYNTTKQDNQVNSIERFIKYVEQTDKLFDKDFNSTFKKYQINNNKLIRTHKEIL